MVLTLMFMMIYSYYELHVFCIIYIDLRSPLQVFSEPVQRMGKLLKQNKLFFPHFILLTGSFHQNYCR